MNSYWLSSCKINSNKSIDDNYIADICIIGAGICGLSTAYYLSKSGLKVVVVDKDNIGQKTSGHTTAKITLQHGLIYDYLINSFGLEFALGYFEANKQAINNIKKIIDLENINCDFSNQDNFIYTTHQHDLTKIYNEIKAVNTLDNYSNFIDSNILNNNNYANFVSDIKLPFKVCGAIKTKNQAQFHPVKYMLGLEKALKNNGALIFTNSLVKDVQKCNDEYICYCENYAVKSKYVVIATHYPFINFPGFYFSKMYQSTSYVVAIENETPPFNGMYINTCDPVLSFRTADYKGKQLLIMSGGDHKTGYSPESEDTFGYKYLENQAKKYYPNSNVLYKWNTRDCITLDKIPYIGEFSSFMPNTFVATGFNKWGMTSSNVAANIIAGKILKKLDFKSSDYADINFMNELIDFSDKYAYVFDSSRLSPIKNRSEVKNMIQQVFKSFVSNRIKIPEENLNKIQKDNGAIIRINGTAVGIYKDTRGKVYAVNPTCTHLGCLLTWNNVDKTWDCPCHGSRFDYTGKNLYDPAFKNLETYGE